MNISYENHGDYYIFSDAPNTRVYLGNYSPEDYIFDQINQAKRSASCYNYEIATGKKVSSEEAFEKSHAKGELIWHGEELTHELDKIENYTYGYRCDYDFQRKTALACMGSPNKTVKYDSKNKEAKRLAEAYYWHDGDLAAYDARQEQFRLDREESERRNPSTVNLMMVGGEPPYYVDWDGNRITSEEHTQMMKEKYGDDVFEKANQRWEEETDPETKKFIKNMVKEICKSPKGGDNENKSE